ncbi:hypothetical protein CRUP_001493 [Coryphaenoides rupestris]|nr:hypothetical protein CRUP_001493 [Coryphaenoides rupestris]
MGEPSTEPAGLKPLDGQLPLHLQVLLGGGDAPRWRTEMNPGHVIIGGSRDHHDDDDRDIIITHLLLLPHDLELLGELDLPLTLRLLGGATQLLAVLVTQRVEGGARVPHLGQLVLQALIQQYQNGESEEDHEQFLKALQNSVTTFLNRVKSNHMRGRSITNDSAVLSLFQSINTMHPQLLDILNQLDEKRRLYSASPPPGLYSASPPPGLYSASPPPGLYSASPPPGLYSASPPPGLYSASPPRVLLCLPSQGSTLPPLPQGSTLPPLPQGSTLPPLPQGSTLPPLPGLYSASHQGLYCASPPPRSLLPTVYSRLFSSSWLRMSSSWGCMVLMDWKSDSTALSLVMLRPRMWLLFTRFRKVVTEFCSAFRNCSWSSSDSPFWGWATVLAAGARAARAGLGDGAGGGGEGGEGGGGGGRRGLGQRDGRRGRRGPVQEYSVLTGGADEVTGVGSALGYAE